MKKLAIAAIMLVCGTRVFAGTDSLIHFANLSPFAATVNFAKGDSDCWHDSGADDSTNIPRYLGYYKSNAVSDAAYKDFLGDFKASFGVDDLSTLAISNMDGSTLALAPAANGQPVKMGLIRGETSASLFGGCKNATSSRGFTITLTDSSGTVVSSNHYVLKDPPGSQWTLSRTKDNGPTALADTATLGSGGKANPVEIALTAGTIILTGVSLGTAGPELFAARAVLQTAVSEVVAAGYGHLLTQTIGQRLFSYALSDGLRRVATGGALITFQKTGIQKATTVAARMVYATLSSGTLIYYQSTKNSSDPLSFNGTTNDPGYSTANLDFTNASLDPLGGTPSASICAYQTQTLASITECRLAGISLQIMPNGSLVYAPLPSVGSGG